MSRKAKQKTPPAGVTRQEIMDVLADEGYSADRHKGRLKEILTKLTQDQDQSPNGDRAALIEEVKSVLDEHQHGKPIAEDVLRTGRRKS